MDVRTFRADSMQAALEQVRRELGPDAAVLHSRQTPAGWLPWQRAQVEVTASCEVVVKRHFGPEAEAERTEPSEATTNLESLNNESEDLLASNARTNLPGSNNANIGSVEDDARQAQLRAERVAEQISNVLPANDARQTGERILRFDEQADAQPPTLLPFPEASSTAEPRTRGLLRDELDLAGVEPELAQAWLQRLEALGGFEQANLCECRRRMMETVAADIRVSETIQTTPSRCTRVALVGPTGVGKTTTIAKLAAEYTLKRQLRVGLITADTFRISAVEQLKTYAEIMDLPLEIVSTAKEMSAALANFDSLDLVFIDTAGHSPQDQVQFGRLRSLLSVAKCDEVHLVLSATSHPKSLRQSLQQFTPVHFNRLLLSKRDEVGSLGHLAEVLTDAVCPWSYVTSGQHVPDDIERANSQRLADQLVSIC